MLVQSCSFWLKQSCLMPSISRFILKTRVVEADIPGARICPTRHHGRMVHLHVRCFHTHDRVGARCIQQCSGREQTYFGVCLVLCLWWRNYRYSLPGRSCSHDADQHLEWHSAPLAVPRRRDQPVSNFPIPMKWEHLLSDYVEVSSIWCTCIYHISYTIYHISCTIYYKYIIKHIPYTIYHWLYTIHFCFFLVYTSPTNCYK